MDYEFIETQKGGRALLSGGYRYLKRRSTGNSTRRFGVTKTEWQQDKFQYANILDFCFRNSNSDTLPICVPIDESVVKMKVDILRVDILGADILGS